MTKSSHTSLELNDISSAIGRSPGEIDCWISFGGNVGDVRGTFDAALALLSLHRQIQLRQRSGLFSSSPMGAHAGSPFLNSICGLTTQLPPQDLLGVLQSVETQLGRVRDLCWGPRTLDLDLLSYGTRIIDEPRLVIPHPALTYRRFVLDPLVEVDANWCHPNFAESAIQLRERLKHRPLWVTLLDVPSERIEALSAQLGPRFPHVRMIKRSEDSSAVLPILLTSTSTVREGPIVDLRRSPGDPLERLTSAFTAIFDSPVRVSDW